MAGLLDRYDAMQKRKDLGGNTALNDGNQAGVGGTAGSQYRRMTEAYNRAIRGLRRAFRGGDVRAGMQEIAVREDAMNKGYTPGGVRKKEDFDSRIMSRVAAMGQAADDRDLGRDLARKRMQLAMDDVQGGQGAPTAQDEPAAVTTPDYLEDPLKNDPVADALDGALEGEQPRRRRNRLVPPGYGETPWWDRVA